MELWKDMSGFDLRAVTLGLLIFLLLVWLARRPKNLPPGPWGWPILGYLPQLAMIKEPTHEVLSKLGERFGPVYSFYLASQLVVVLQDFDVIKEGLARFPMSGRPTYQISQKTLPGHGVLSASGEKWTELRRFTVTTLRGLGMAKSSFEEKISTEAKCLLGELQKTAGQALDPRNLIGMAVANVVCSVILGKRFEYTDARFRELLHINDTLVEIGGAGGFLEFIPIFAKLTFLPIVQDQIAANEKLKACVGEIMADHDAGYDPRAAPRDYVDTFYNEMRSKEDQCLATHLNAASLYYCVTGLLGAGSETTTSTLRWAILYMIGYPGIQTQVQREMDGVVGRARLPRLADKPQLPYTQAVLCEIQRLGSVVPLSIPHRCLEDISVLSYHIPKGAIIIPNLWHIHHDATEWTNPGEFQPERFLDNEGKFKSRDRLIPFGTGRRICLGKHLAKMELFVFFTSFLHQFTFEKAEDATVVSFESQEGITLGPVAYRVRALPRA